MNCGRIRKWTNDNGTVLLHPDCEVLQRYLHGGDIALGLVHKGRAGGGKQVSRSRKRTLFPPAGGWR